MKSQIKYILLFLFTLFALPMSESVFSDQNGQLFSQKVTPQTFRSNTSSTQDPNSTVDAEMAKVKAIMEAAKKAQETKQVQQTKPQQDIPNFSGSQMPQSTQNQQPIQNPQELIIPPAPTTSIVNPVSPSPSPLTHNGMAQSLEAQISQLNQNNLIFQQSMVQKLEVLNNKNKLLEGEVQKLHSVLSLLNQEVISMNSAMQTLKQQQSVESNSKFSLGGTAILAVVFCLSGILMTLVILWIVGRFRTNLKTSRQAVNPNQKIKEDDEEYDFMNSQEAIPAKLDLARAYITMGDTNAAERVLKSIMGLGNSEQCSQAQNLLNQIAAKP